MTSDRSLDIPDRKTIEWVRNAFDHSYGDLCYPEATEGSEVWPLCDLAEYVTRSEVQEALGWAAREAVLRGGASYANALAPLLTSAPSIEWGAEV